jgi:hypothetical protein
MPDTYARFQTGDACLYRGQRYTIISPVWINPFPGVMTWHIERLLDSSDQIEVPRTIDLEWIMANGVIQTRDDQRYQAYNVSEDEIENEDDPPTWQDIDDLRERHVKLEAQIAALQTQLKTKFRRTGIKRRIAEE